MTQPFYRAFEERYRGSRELIKNRQAAYIPFIKPLTEIYAECPALDLGCGRGEWLELLAENGFQPKGVDLDEGMLEACHVLNLSAEQGEALATLEGLADESLTVVSGFHIAEHIPFSSLQQLVAQILRVLKPAGLLILETPNPENLIVGTNNFYLDPTHERPIPSLLLRFLTEHAGFARSKLLRLQESSQLVGAAKLNLLDVLGGVSPDYAIVAQKAANKEYFSLFDQAFTKEYGLSLDVLAGRYDNCLDSRFQELAEKLNNTIQAEVETSARAQINLTNFELRAAQMEAVANQLRQQLQEADLRIQTAEVRSLEAELALRESISRAAHAEARQAAAEEMSETWRRQSSHATSELLELYKEQRIFELKIEQEEARRAGLEQREKILEENVRSLEDLLQRTQEQLTESLNNAHHWYVMADASEQRVNDLLNSTSWRITWPLRMLTTATRWLVRLPVRLVKAVFRPILLSSIRVVLKRPSLKNRLNNLVKRFPKIYRHLLQFAYYRGLLSPASPYLSLIVMESSRESVSTVGEHADLSGLTPRARKIFFKLKESIEKEGVH